MVKASELRAGAVIKSGNDLFKVLVSELKVGTAKLPSSVHVRLKNIRTGTQTEQRLHPEEKVEDVGVETVTLEYSYHDSDSYFFLHPVTFDQVEIPPHMLGSYSRFLSEGCKLAVDFIGEEPVDVHLPKTVDATVANTGAPIHGDVDSAPKSAVLDNGLEIQVPQFIKTGDRVRIELETSRYLERLH